MTHLPSFELESALDEDLLDDEEKKKNNCCFPLEVLPCVPAGIRRLIPPQFHYFQGWIHLWLFLGTLCCFALSAHAFVNIYQSLTGQKKLQGYAVQEAIEFIFMVPCLYYFIRTLGQYDDDLHKKKAMAEAARRKLIDAYTNTLDDMSEILDHAAEVNAGFAERSFENKRRDFIRFLERWQHKFGSININSSEEMRNLYEQLKRFILNWFAAFAECSIEPVKSPNVVVTEAELDKCVSLEELCLLCVARLKAAEVKFISSHLEKDRNLIQNGKKELKAITFVGTKLSTTFAHTKKTPTPWALVSDAAGKGVGYLQGVSWCVFGCKNREEYKLEAGLEDEAGFPCLLPFGCGIMVVLSREHIILMCGFCFGWVILGLELWFPDSKKRMLILMTIFQITMFMTLIRFEKIDVLQRLAREARNIRKEKDEVQERHLKMKKFWTKAQQQTDLWLHRTVPRLDLFSEVHGQLEDMDTGLALEGMAIANNKLEMLHKNLGPLEYWFSDGELSEQQKKDFDQSIVAICQETQFTTIMYKLDGLNDNVQKMTAAKALPQAPRQVKFEDA